MGFDPNMIAAFIKSNHMSAILMQLGWILAEEINSTNIPKYTLLTKFIFLILCTFTIMSIYLCCCIFLEIGVGVLLDFKTYCFGVLCYCWPDIVNSFLAFCISFNLVKTRNET